MIYTEFDPLEEVIVGDIYAPGDLDKFLPEKSLAGFNKILEETKQDLDNLSNFISSAGIKVHRPKVYNYEHNFNMPGFDINLPMSPVVPRDTYMVRGKTIIQTYTGLTDRYFDSLSYYDIFANMFEEGYNWIAQPLPMLKNLNDNENWFLDDMLYYTKLSDRVLWHTANMFQAGDAVIVNSQGPGSVKGYEWIQRNLPSTRFISNPGTVMRNFGHIDHGFLLVDDDTVIHAGIEWVPEVLRNKKLIDCKPFLPKLVLDNFMKDVKSTKSKYDIEWIDKYLENWKGYNQEVCFDLNVLILDSKNIIWGREIPDLFRFLKKEHGIESHVCNTRHSLYWEGGIHCSTLDIKRKGQSRKII
jgi:N-dimethylarginine dimethylaminohydrolase